MDGLEGQRVDGWIDVDEWVGGLANVLVGRWMNGQMCRCVGEWMSR